MPTYSFFNSLEGGFEQCIYAFCVEYLLWLRYSWRPVLRVFAWDLMGGGESEENIA